MKSENLTYYDTLVTNPGSLDSRVKAATGLVTVDTLLKRMKSKPVRRAVDIMIPNACGQHCLGCYFQERPPLSNVPVVPELIPGLAQMAEQLAGDNPDNFCLYPREITTGLPLLGLFQKYGQDEVLTNGKYLHRPGVLEDLARHGVRKINITCPGSPESYAEYTGEDASTYRRLIENIKLALEHGFNINVYMPIFKDNVNEVVPTVQMLGGIGVKSVSFIRLSPMGFGLDLPQSKFVNDEEILKFLRNLNQARHLTRGKMQLNLFNGSWGVNFYGKNIYRYLSGLNNIYPNSTYFCPMIDNQFCAVMLGSEKVYGCFQGVSFDEFVIGSYGPEGLKLDSSMPNSDWLSANLRGICSQNNCPEQLLCLGGCRSNAFNWARQKGDKDPITAGQDFCLTNFISRIQMSQP